MEAGSLAQARYILEIRGYSDIEFLNDEHGDDIQRATLSGTGVSPPDPAVWTVENEAAAWRRKGIGAHLWWAFKQNLIVLGPLAYWNWCSVRSGRPYSGLDWVGFVATPLYLAYFFLLSLPMMIFQQLLRAAVWCDWAEVRRYVRWARGLRRLMITGIPESELDFREAYATAADGRVDEALRSLEKYRGHADMAEYIFLARLSSVYEYAGRHDEMIGMLEESAAKGPGGASEWIDVAMARVRHRRDAVGAKAALERTADKEIPSLAGAALLICRGMIASEEGEDSRACELLNEGVGKLDAFAGNPLIQVVVSEAKSYLVISRARLGQRDGARADFAAIRPLLVARKEVQLIERCQAALAG